MTGRGFLAGLTGTMAALALLTAPDAMAGAPINLGTPFQVGQTSVAVDPAGNAYVAYSNTKDLPPETVNVVDVCTLPVGATACAHGIVVIHPANGGQYIDGVTVLLDGTTVVVLMDTYGTTAGAGGSYEPVQMWTSTDGGATFSAVNGGTAVARGAGGPINGVIVPGTDFLGFGFDVPGGGPTFHAFPGTSPPECSEASCASGYALLEPTTNPDQLSNQPGMFASQTGATPGVMGIFMADFTNGPFGCSDAQSVPFSTVYAYGSGLQSTTNDYNLAPGTANSAWKVALSKASCNSEYAAVAGGKSGFGILQANALTSTTDYLRFDQANMSFDLPAVKVAPKGEQQAALSQDAAGGIYATYLYTGVGDPIALAYSGDGGAHWTSNTLNPDTDQKATDVTSSVSSGGQGWAVWADNGSVFAQPFTAKDAQPAPTPVSVNTLQTAGTDHAANIDVPAGTIGEVDQATLTGANAANATGTVSYGLYSDTACSPSGLVFNAGTSAVSGGVAGASQPVSTALAPGSYYWKAAYSGSAASGNMPGVSQCGSEVLTVLPAATSGGTGTTTGTTITLTVSCSAACTITITITVPSGAAADIARAGHKPRKLVTIATGRFSLKQAGKHKLTLKLTQAGKRLVGRHHGKLKATLSLSDKTAHGTFKSTKALKITRKG